MTDDDYDEAEDAPASAVMSSAGSIMSFSLRLPAVAFAILYSALQMVHVWQH